MKKSRISLNESHDRHELGSDVTEGVWVLGVDEVGAGCLSGPLLCSAVAYKVGDVDIKLSQDLYINDSKKLKPSQRETLKKFIENKDSFLKSLSKISVEVIDRINILQARFLGMSEAVFEVVQRIRSIEPSSIIVCCVDGDKIPPALLRWAQENKSQNIVKSFVKGDSRLFCIALASNFAKHNRDELMAELSKSFPLYLWEKNVGYGTPEHLSLIEKFGLTPHHRRTFCKRFLSESKPSPNSENSSIPLDF